MWKSKSSRLSHSLVESFPFFFFNFQCQIKVACQVIRLVSLFNMKLRGVDVFDIFSELFIFGHN